MFISRQLKVDYDWNYQCFTRYLITIFMVMTILSVVHGDPMPKPDIDNLSEINCWTHTTCTQCTNARCTWFNKNQMCTKSVMTDTTDNLIIVNKSFCPKYTVVESTIVNNITNSMIITFNVSFSNETEKQREFIKHLNHTEKKKCNFSRDKTECELTMDYNQIFCTCYLNETKSQYNIIDTSLRVSYFWIVFDNTALRFENITDHYVVTKPKVDYAINSCVHCQWDMYPNRYFCIWCTKKSSKNTLRLCVVRNLLNFSVVGTKNITIIGDQCPIARIERIETLDPKVLDISKPVRFTIHNHRLLSNANPQITATIAGHNCIDIHDDNDTITCTVPQISATAVPVADNGYLDVTYNSQTVNLTLRSEHQFRLDGYRLSNSTNKRCASYAKPTIDANQTFFGFSSGGSDFLVRGQHFACLKSIQLHLMNNTIFENSPCTSKNDTYMTCQRPATNGTIRDVSKLTFDFTAKIDKQTEDFPPRSSQALEYLVYPDPLFSDFTVDGCMLNINGVDLDHGYNITNLSIWWEKNSSSDCLVTEVKSRRIVCQFNSTLLPRYQTIAVSIGNFWWKTLFIKQISGSKFSAQSNSHSVNYLPSVFAIGAYVSFIVFLCIMLVRLRNSKSFDLLTFYQRQSFTEIKQYDEPQHSAEMEPLNEHH